MAARPIVDGIEQTHQGRLNVIRLNANEQAGRMAGAEYSFEFTPSFILFSGDGEQLWRGVGSIDPARVQELLDQSE
jgi:hypothetical protein